MWFNMYRGISKHRVFKKKKSWFSWEVSVSILLLPLSVYHFGLLMNSFTSSTILSATPFSKTTEDRGRRRRGNPKGRHSAPRAVYITVRPSSCFKANSRATESHTQHINDCAYTRHITPRPVCGACNLWFQYCTVFSYLPSWRMFMNNCLSLPRAVNVTDSHGVPVWRSTICFSLVLSTRIHLLPYLVMQTSLMRKCTTGFVA